MIDRIFNLQDHPDVFGETPQAIPGAEFHQHLRVAPPLEEPEVGNPRAVSRGGKLLDILLDEVALRAFVAGRLADFKVPRVVRFVDRIPKGATGKIQRIGLAQKLGLEAFEDWDDPAMEAYDAL